MPAPGSHEAQHATTYHTRARTNICAGAQSAQANPCCTTHITAISCAKRALLHTSVTRSVRRRASCSERRRSSSCCCCCRIAIEAVQASTARVRPRHGGSVECHQSTAEAMPHGRKQVIKQTQRSGRGNVVAIHRGLSSNDTTRKLRAQLSPKATRVLEYR
jgi:hypothetical protein